MGDSPGKRLVSFRESLGLSQRGLAEGVGTSQATVGFIEKDERPPSRSFLQKISDAYGVNADWLLHGHGDMLRPPGQGFSGRTALVEPPDFGKPGHGDMRIDGYDCVRIRRMDLSVSAGRGVVAIDGPEAAPVIVPTAWMQRLQINADAAVLVQVKGDSMAPAIPDGSLVLVHLMEKLLEKAGVYAFSLEGEAFVKRLIPADLDPDGRPRAITILSDNPAYPPRAVSGNSINALRIAGRVRGVMAFW